GHAVAEGIAALLDVAGIHPRGSDADADLAAGRQRIVHLTDDQHLARGALAFVPDSFHAERRRDAGAPSVPSPPCSISSSPSPPRSRAASPRWPASASGVSS